MLFLSKQLTNIFIRWSNRTYDSEDVEIFTYGFECLLNSLFVDLILVIWGIATQTLIPTFYWLISFCIFRHYAGGAHASTNIRCIFISSLLGISNYIALHYFSFILKYQTIFFIALIMICTFFSPIESTKKELTSTEKFFQKCVSILIILFVWIIVILFPNKITVSMLYGLITSNILIIVSLIKNGHHTMKS